MNSSRARIGKFVLLALLSCCSYFFFSRLVVMAVEVRGSSMSPTLVSGDMVILNRFASSRHVPQRGELVVLREPDNGELVVKRIVGLPEETIQVSLDSAFINGKKLSEPYIVHAAKELVGKPGAPTVVPKGNFYVLGDNRHNSIDSRVFGPVPRDNIIGIINL